MENREVRQTGAPSTRNEPRIAPQSARKDVWRSFDFLRGRRFPIIDQVRDVDGARFDVRDIRATKHGFELLFGTPERTPDVDHRPWPQLILTEDLRDFWLENQTKHNGLSFDLPASYATLCRARKQLGLGWQASVLKFWTDRIEDLESLRPRQFAVKHGVDPQYVNYWRWRLGVTKRRRARDWWRAPETLNILLSDLTPKEASLALGVSTSYIYQLRARATKANSEGGKP